MEAATNDFKAPSLRYVSFSELMYDTLHKHEHCLWEKIVHCQNQTSIAPEQISILKGIIKEKKKIIRLFNKLMDLTTDKSNPCQNCILCQEQIEIAEDRVIAVAKNQPTEADFRKQFKEFQEELAKHCSLQANACSVVTDGSKGVLLDLPPITPVGVDVAMATVTMPMIPTTTAATTENDESMTMAAFEAIPKKEAIL